jgi:hypothetical protein
MLSKQRRVRGADMADENDKPQADPTQQFMKSLENGGFSHSSGIWKRT